MNFIGLVPVLYRWIAIALIAVAFGGWCFVKGLNVGEAKLAAAETRALKEGGRITVARAAVTEKIVFKYLPAITKIETVTETIVKEVPIYVKVTDPPMPAGFRVLHDAAAAGRVPDPARISDAAAVSAQDVASTVAANYGACLSTATRLTGLQEWVREQGKVK